METPVHVMLGRVMRGVREDAGLSLRAVAEKAGISAAYLGEIERGVKEPSSVVLANLAKALNVTLSELYYALALELRKRELLAAKRAAFAQPSQPTTPTPLRTSSDFGFRTAPPDRRVMQPHNMLTPMNMLDLRTPPNMFHLPPPIIVEDPTQYDDEQEIAEQAAADLPPLPEKAFDLPPALANEAEVRSLLSAFGDFLLSHLPKDV